MTAVTVTGSLTKALLHTEGKDLVYEASHEIATGARRLVDGYFGLKSYDRWPAQRSDHAYGYGPSHGSVWFKVGLTDDARKRIRGGGTLSEEEIEEGLALLGVTPLAGVRERMRLEANRKRHLAAEAARLALDDLLLMDGGQDAQRRLDAAVRSSLAARQREIAIDEAIKTSSRGLDRASQAN